MQTQTVTRKELIRLYKVSDCSEWRGRIKKYLDSTSLETDTHKVEINADDIKYAAKNASAKQKQEIEKSGVNISSSSTADQLPTYEAACKVLGEKVVKNLSAGDQIQTLVRAANYLDNNKKSWRPNFSGSSYNYLPYFIKQGSVWVLDVVYRYRSYACCPVGFYFKDEETASEMVTKHIKLYQKWLEG